LSRFDILAAQWDLNPRRVKSAKITTDKLKKLIDIENFDILDYGAGSGLISFNLFEDVNSVTAMDNSKGMLKEIQRKIDKANISNIYPLLHDGNKDSFKSKKFDLAVTAMTLHHIKDPKSFIKNITKSLKDGGYLAISDLESEDGTFHTDGNKGVEHFGFDKSDIISWFEDAKLKLIYCETNETIQKHKDFDIFLAVGKNV
jgi:2-polyprenyl-3-methyl-5-hydroxy-6-metoxy-1,4-benzoquinol methylase